MSVVVCTDIRGNKLHRQMGVGIVVTSGNQHGVMIAHWPGMSEMWVRVLLYLTDDNFIWVPSDQLHNTIVLYCNSLS